MKKPVVDYRDFRLSKLTDPRFSHLLLLLGWPVYFALYFLTENLIPVENCHVIHIPLDDLIPFCEIFLIPYVFWYLLIVISLVWFALYNVEGFKKLQTYIMLTQAIAMTVYILYPNCQDLRPEVFPRETFFTYIIGLMYQFDTNTGVFPSLHVGYSIAIASVWLKEKSVGWPWKLFVLVSVILISLSTAFIKQHSIADAFAAVFMCLFIELFLYRNYWKEKLFSRKKNA
ncbi:MAG: phosphatidic acid phosphatase [Clostridia bacterium]|nr:phosphatidic acid phosphatase [Clostridia bacterium]